MQRISQNNLFSRIQTDLKRFFFWSFKSKVIITIENAPSVYVYVVITRDLGLKIKNHLSSLIYTLRDTTFEENKSLWNFPFMVTGQWEGTTPSRFKGEVKRWDGWTLNCQKRGFNPFWPGDWQKTRCLISICICIYLYCIRDT